MDKKTALVFAAGVLLGVIAAPKLRALPVVSKLPSA
jgi:hypothetical protein